MLSTPTPVDALAAFLTQLLGPEVTQRLRQNPSLALPYAEDDLPDETYLSRGLQTIFSPDDLQVLAGRVDRWTLDQQRPLLQEIETRKWTEYEQSQALEQARDAVQTAQDGREAAEVEVFRLKKELTRRLPARVFVEAFFRADDERPLRELLLEAAEHPAPELADFLSAFAGAWTELRQQVAALTRAGTPDLHRLHAALSEFLTRLSGQHLPQRRPLLDQVARWASGFFEDYVFVSPEESALVDPAIHNAHGLGSGQILEGLSFAVIRRQSRVAVLYADVKVH
jgi:hypothetical protein